MCRKQGCPRRFATFLQAFVAMVLMMSGLTAPAHADLVRNGGFETGDFTGWTLTGSLLVFVEKLTGVWGGTPYGPESGTYYALFDAYMNNPATISQQISTTAGTRYDFSFWMGSVGGTPNAMSVAFGSDAVLSMVNESDRAYVKYTYTVTATSNTTLISFSGADGPLWVDIDGISVVAAVSEPACMAIFGAGIAGLSLWRKWGPNRDFCAVRPLGQSQPSIR